MNFKDIVPVVWSNNENRFKAGKHYFKLEGAALKQFKDLSAESGAVGLERVGKF